MLAIGADTLEHGRAVIEGVRRDRHVRLADRDVSALEPGVRADRGVECVVAGRGRLSGGERTGVRRASSSVPELPIELARGGIELVARRRTRWPRRASCRRHRSRRPSAPRQQLVERLEIRLDGRRHDVRVLGRAAVRAKCALARGTRGRSQLDCHPRRPSPNPRSARGRRSRPAGDGRSARHEGGVHGAEERVDRSISLGRCLPAMVAALDDHGTAAAAVRARGAGPARQVERRLLRSFALVSVVMTASPWFAFPPPARLQRQRSESARRWHAPGR